MNNKSCQVSIYDDTRKYCTKPVSNFNIILKMMYTLTHGLESLSLYESWHYI